MDLNGHFAQVPRGRHVVVIGGLAWSLVNFRLDLMRRMIRQGHKVTAIAPRFDAQVRAALEAEGIACRSVPLDRTGLNPVADLRSLVALIRVLRALGPDCVLCYTMKPILYGLLAARIARVPARFALFTGLGYAFNDPAPTGRRRIVRAVVIALHRIALRKITSAFCYNAQERADIRGFRLIPPATPLIDIPGSGVDTRRFAPVREKAGSDVRFLFVGRLLHSKGLGVLAQAARQVRAQGLPFSLSVLGPMDSNPDAITSAQLADWQTEGVVHYLGETRDVQPFLAQADVFVLPTILREGVPRTILEAMASGLPVITTDAPGCGETIEDGVSGLVVPMGDADALAAAMTRFIETPALIETMGQAARERVCARNDVDLINARLLVAMGLEADGDGGARTRADPRMESAA